MNDMSHMEELRRKIEAEKVNLDKIVERGLLTEEVYKQSIVVDELMSQCIKLGNQL